MLVATLEEHHHGQTASNEFYMGSHLRLFELINFYWFRLNKASPLTEEAFDQLIVSGMHLCCLNRTLHWLILFMNILLV